MNIYDYFQQPNELDGFDRSEFIVPVEAFNKVYGTKVRMPEYEAAIARDAKYSYHYASMIRERFELGEPAIEKSNDYEYVWLGDQRDAVVSLSLMSTYVHVNDAYNAKFGTKL